MDSTESNATLRRMQAQDADQIKAIYDTITQKQTPADDFKRLVRTEINRGEDSACFVAEINGKIVGFMITYVLPFGFGVERSAWLANVGVLPKYMGQGIGAQLAREAFRFYQEKGIYKLYTSAQWDATDLLSFFKTLGFTRSEFINLRKTLE